jgi:superoxide dismutase, Fe-Mn family
LAVPREEVLADQENLTLLDVCRAGAYEASKSVITGATWRDPEKLAEWSSSLRDKPVVVYCVYGHEVGQSTAAILRTRVSTLASWSAGFTTWTAAGRPLQEKWPLYRDEFRPVERRNS